MKRVWPSFSLRRFLPWMGIFLCALALLLVVTFPTERLVARLLQNPNIPVEVATIVQDSEGFLLLKGVRLKGTNITLNTLGLQPHFWHLLHGVLAGNVRVDVADGQISGEIRYNLFTHEMRHDLTVADVALSSLPLPDNMIIWRFVDHISGTINGWSKGVSTGAKLSDLKLDGALSLSPLILNALGSKQSLRIKDVHTGFHLTNNQVQIDVNGGNALRMSNKIYLDLQNVLNSRVEGTGLVGFDFLPPSWQKEFTLEGTLRAPRIN